MLTTDKMLEATRKVLIESFTEFKIVKCLTSLLQSSGLLKHN